MNNELTSAIADTILVGRKIEFFMDMGQMVIEIKHKETCKQLHRQCLPIDSRHGMDDIRVSECIKFMNLEINKKDAPDGYGGC
jgi:hypothetical protein